MLSNFGSLANIGSAGGAALDKEVGVTEAKERERDCGLFASLHLGM